MSDAGELHLRERDGVLRCAYCHDAVGADAVACDRCGTRLHAECAAGRRCPTLGCEGLAAPTGSDLLRNGFAIACGIVFPVLAFTANLALDDSIVRELGDARLNAVRLILYSSKGQQAFFPLLGWSIASLAAAVAGWRSAGIRIGLWGGVLLAALFSAIYLPVLPLALVATIIGIGILGFAPYFALVAFLLATNAYERARPEKEPRGPLIALVVAWTIGAVVSAVVAARNCNEFPL